MNEEDVGGEKRREKDTFAVRHTVHALAPLTTGLFVL